MNKKKLWLMLIPVVVFAVIYYFTMFNLSPFYFDGAIAWAVLIIVELLILMSAMKRKQRKIIGTAIGIIIAVICVGKIAGSDIFNASKAYSRIGEVEETSFKDVILPIDNTQIPTVDADLALKQANKKLGAERGLGSQVDVGSFTLQQVNGELVFVAPLDHEGFMKWFSNKTTPGYVKVSASDPDDVELVQELDGKELKLQYLESGWFGDNLFRHIRNCGYRTNGLSDMTFELDEGGRPYWTVTTYKNTGIWNYPEATGVVVCDPQTGECKWYSKDEAPEWIDKIQPDYLVSGQIDDYGKYEKGFMNSIFGKNGVIKKTDGMLTVYNNGDCYYYTGMTSAGNDDATTGFMMVNTRTKEAKYFAMEGATEEAAQGSAEGKVQEKGYNATLPVPINVQGIPTYFMTLKDKAGLIKAYAMVNIENYAIVATGESIDQVQKEYISAMLNAGNDNVIGSDESYLYNVEGKITRISANITGGDTTYYIIINDDRTKLYVANGALSDELPITMEGDNVKISFIDDKNGTVDVSKFDNLDFTQEKSEDQQKKDEQSTESISDDETNNITEVDPEKAEEEWNSLSDEEKAKILEESKK